MSDPDDFDAVLKQRFDHEHRHVPADPFVGEAMIRIRFQRQLAARVRWVLRVLALLAVIVASPWLIDGATRLNAALASSLTWTAGLPGAWMLGALTLAAVLISRLRSR